MSNNQGKPVKKLIVYAGPNGAGKSTLRDFGDDNLDLYIDADQIARQIAPEASGGADWNAGREAITLFHQALAEGKSLSLETTLTGQTPLRRMVEAKVAGYHVDLRFIALRTPKLHIARVQERVAKGGHFIPPDTILRRYGRSLDNLPAAAKLANHITIFDNSGFEQRELLRVEDRQIIFLHPAPPAWFQTRLPLILAALAERAEGAS